MNLENNDLTGKIIAAAMAVHRPLRPGYFEKFDEEASALELGSQPIPFERHRAIPVFLLEQISIQFQNFFYPA